MPSIPQSLLWISLVVLWLFVLVPMLISKRESVRRTSDVALATRVLNGGRNAQRLRRGPAAGHNSDPHWRPAPDDLDEELEETEPTRPPRRAVVVAAAVTEPAEPDYLDVDIVEEDSGALPMGSVTADVEDIEHVTEQVTEQVAGEVAEQVAEQVAEEVADDSDPQTDQLPLDLEPTEPTEPTDEVEETADEITESAEAVDEDDTAEDQADLAAHEYEYVADSSGLEPEAESDDETESGSADDGAPVTSLGASRQRRRESTTAAKVSERKYKFRKRVLAVFALILVASAAAAFLVTPTAWWVCGTAATLTLLYLAYLRRQTRIEEQLRRRRAQRLKRSRLGVENTDDHKLDVVPARLRRPGAAVLDIDDEDPIFEHLEYTSFSRHYDLPRASGQ
jgi:hypothetical protein